MIRKARGDEASAVRDVVIAAYNRYLQVIGTAPGPMLDNYAVRIAADEVWVLEDTGEIAGVLVLENGPEFYMLDNIAVLPQRQGIGVGKLLLDFAEAEAVRCGWDSISLYTNALMVENIAIYRARGYVEQDRRTEKGFDRVYMTKSLSPGRATPA